VLSSSIRLARIKTLANDHPHTKLGSDPLFTYLFIENEKVSKDKDTNFIFAIWPSDWPLAETQAVKPVKRKKCKRYQVHQTKDLEVLKSKGDIEVSIKDYDSL